MIVSEIAPERFDALLPARGIRIETGPFAFRITSWLPELAAPLRLLYADFPAARFPRESSSPASARPAMSKGSPTGELYP